MKATVVKAVSSSTKIGAATPMKLRKTTAWSTLITISVTPSRLSHSDSTTRLKKALIGTSPDG